MVIRVSNFPPPAAICCWKLVNAVVSWQYPLLTTSKRLYLTGWLKITPDPFPCNCQSGYLLDGVTFNHYTYPFAQWKTCHKMAETYVSRPHFEELTLDSGKVHVLVCGFQKILLLFCKQTAAHRSSPYACLDSPTRQPNSGLRVGRALAR